MSQPRLLFVVTEDWYFVSHRLPLAIAAREAGFDVAVATRVQRDGQQIEAAGIRLLPFALSRRSGNPFPEIFRLFRLYRHERPTIVHHVALKPVLYGTLAARLARVPRIINAVAGLGWLFTSRGWLAACLRPSVRGLLVRLLAASSVRTIVQNPDDRELLAKAGVEPARLRLIRGAGVDVTAFAPSPEAPPEPVTVMLVSRMLWDKGVGEFVSAAQMLHARGLGARFVLVGEPDPANPASIPQTRLQQWAGHHGIEWWGHREAMPRVLKQAHIACLPSYYGEGIPKSLLEAAACGLPVVTTDAPGCREVVVEGDNGFLVPVRDAKALAAALETLIRDPSLRQRMGQQSRTKAVAEFSQPQVIGETLQLYREMTA
jgi:glycosyltransferase involved in cell wall biosynthesis